MIDFQDVRAGNQMLFNSSGSTVTILKVENNRALVESFPESSYCSGAEISGIPLTTSLLQKLSFTNSKEQNTWNGQGINIEMKPDGFFYGLRITSQRFKMQYLHQLQNYLTDFFLLFKEQDRSLNLPDNEF